MAIQQKAQWARLKVGLMAIIALVVLGVLIFLLTGTEGFFKDRSPLVTFLGDSAALNPGAPVRLNGIIVGEVDKVDLSGSSDPGRIVRLDLQVDTDKLSQIPVDSEAAVTAENLLGIKYINIKKGTATETVKPGAEIKSRSPLEWTELTNKADALLAELQSALHNLDTILATVAAGKGSIGRLLVDDEVYRNVRDITAEAKKLATAMNTDKGTLGKLVYTDQLHAEIQGSVLRLNRMLDGIEQGQGTAGKLMKDPGLYDDTRKAINEVRATIADVNSGKGTVGKLLKSDELHNQVAAILTRLDTVVAKIDSGQGTLGQLLVNAQLYESLNGATRELEGLMKDFRANPRKFLRIKLALF